MTSDRSRFNDSWISLKVLGLRSSHVQDSIFYYMIYFGSHI